MWDMPNVEAEDVEAENDWFPPGVNALNRQYHLLTSGLECAYGQCGLHVALRKMDELISGRISEWEESDHPYLALISSREFVKILDKYKPDETCLIPVTIFRVALAETLRRWEGPFVSENGQVLREEQYLDGLRHGMWKRFYPDGTLRSEGNYGDDLRDGTWLAYFPGGQPESKNEYRRGVVHGEQIYWRENGSIMSREVFHEGRQADGRSYEAWDEHGQETAWVEYANGKPVRRWQRGKTGPENHL